MIIRWRFGFPGPGGGNRALAGALIGFRTATADHVQQPIRPPGVLIKRVDP